MSQDPTFLAGTFGAAGLAPVELNEEPTARDLLPVSGEVEEEPTARDIVPLGAIGYGEPLTNNEQPNPQTPPDFVKYCQSFDVGLSMHKETHSLWMGYAMWILGFTGAHRFYYGKRVSGLIYLCTLGLLGIGWLFDLFWMPMLYKGAKKTYYAGDTSYDLAWILLTFGGIFGLHRFYLGKFVTGLLYLCTGGLFTFGIWYDFLFMNEYVAEANRKA